LINKGEKSVINTDHVMRRYRSIKLD